MYFIIVIPSSEVHFILMDLFFPILFISDPLKEEVKIKKAILKC